jgi:basic membrane protein A
MRFHVRFLALVAIVGMLVSACGSSNSSGKSGSGGSGGKQLKVALVVNGTLGDKGFFDSADRGVKRMQSQLGAQTKVLQASPTNPSEWLQNLQSVSTGNYNLVITGTSQMVNQITTVAKAHKSQKFIMFDAPVNEPNIASIAYDQNEGSFLAGELAALAASDTKDFPLSKGSHKIGLVGGMNIPVINDFLVGYEKGARYIDPHVQILKSYIGNFTDANAGYNQTKAMYDQGADVVFAVAGGAGLGVLKASKDANKYSIGVDSDQNNIEPGHVLASMVKRVDNSIFDLAKLYKQGKLKFGKTYIYGLHNKGVDLILDNKLVPASAVAKINTGRQAVASGKVTVPSAMPK